MKFSIAGDGHEKVKFSKSEVCDSSGVVEVNILALFTDTKVNNCFSIYHKKTKHLYNNLYSAPAIYSCKQNNIYTLSVIFVNFYPLEIFRLVQTFSRLYPLRNGKSFWFCPQANSARISTAEQLDKYRENTIHLQSIRVHEYTDYLYEKVLWNCSL